MALESLPATGACPSSAHGDNSFDDGVYYPVCDDMGESGLQNFVNFQLLALLRDYFATLGRPVLVGSDQFFYYKQGDPRSVVAPDVYVVDDETLPQMAVPSWKVWEHGGKVPSLALEIVSDEYRKDYADRLIDRYQQLGVRELVRYDPGHGGRARRRLLSHFVRDEGGLLIPRPSAPNRVRLVSFDFWLVQQPDLTLRIGLGPDGSALWPTLAEKNTANEQRAAAEAERAPAEAERAAAEAARAAAAAEQQAAAEAEVQRLRAELARLRK